ncbi:S9 family peptidase [Alteromonas sp. ASW11-36]|uniref:S9 family peptidase n=1 Tax=Alteromonas arenosi TaxID=3055817 RepID=A0ABT7T2K6_9ALTE|nr:S9 family peptidase [Alteromonas sp. ASW11-36]MDM7861989.1 S9 family peptidase [Alteromonas sp. ASW11-36]
MLKYLALVLLISVVPHFSYAESISPAEFAKNDIYDTAELSPDGSKLAVRIIVDGKRQLAVFDVNTFETIGGARLGGNNEVGRFFWANDERIVMQIWQSRSWSPQPGYYGELFVVDFDGDNQELIYGYRAGENQVGSKVKRKEYVRGWARIISTLPEDDEHILIESEPWSDGGEKISTVHKLNIYNGRMSREITKAPINYSTFIADRQGDLQFVTGTDESNTQRTFRYVDEEWVEISSQLGDAFQPIAMNNAGTELIFVDDYEQDKEGLFAFNLETGDRRLIYTDENVDITSVSLNSDRSSAYALRLDDGYPTYAIFDGESEEAQIFKALLGTFTGYSLNILTRADKGRLWLLYAYNDIDSGTFYLYDREANKLQSLFSNFTHVPRSAMSESIPISFAARDGYQVSGYITYPVSVPETQNVPLITLVHGGPIARDYWVFDREVQMLAAQGYAVLRVNFRGSSGYGKAHRNAGYKRWGDLIQHDIIDATKYVISQGGIAADKVCIMGASFGGYSAVMSATIEPDLFKCAVATVGVYDLEMMHSEGDIPEALWGKSFVDMAIGSDPELLHAFSPVNNVSKLKAPVLIAHGEEDRRVPFEHAEALRAAMEANGKEYEWFVESTEAHGFYKEESRARYYETVAAFLAKHLQ